MFWNTRLILGCFFMGALSHPGLVCSSRTDPDNSLKTKSGSKKKNLLTRDYDSSSHRVLRDLFCADRSDEPKHCKVFDGFGRRVFSMASVEDLERVYVVPQNRNFVWPTIEIGRKVTVPHVKTPLGESLAGPVVVRCLVCCRFRQNLGTTLAPRKPENTPCSIR